MTTPEEARALADELADTLSLICPPGYEATCIEAAAALRALAGAQERAERAEARVRWLEALAMRPPRALHDALWRGGKKP